MNDIEFYLQTKTFLERKAEANGVTDLQKYYKVTDKKLAWYQAFPGDEISCCFAQLAFHGQNATMISNIVKFEANYDFLYKVCKNFDPHSFLNAYCPNTLESEDQKISRIVEALRYHQDTNPRGLVWNSDKSKSENKDKIAKRYAKLLIKGAEYLSGFKTKAGLINDLMSHYVGRTREARNKNLIDYFMNKMGKGSGFSVALTCDYLKELDECFDFLAKPDVHLKDAMVAYLGRPKDYYGQSESKARECLNDVQKVVDGINGNLKDEEKITVYQFDRMVWLICSGKFFLDDVGLTKNDFLRSIR